MFTGIYQSIATLVVILAFYVIDILMMSRYERERQASGSGRSWDFTLFMVTASLLLVLQPIAFPIMSFIITSHWALGIQITGLIVIIFALSFHIWARRHLRQFYAERVEVQPRHRLIDTGPYRLVRHPIITSFFGIVTGVFLINPSLITLLMAIYTFWDFTKAARQEERLLNSTLPDYAAYMEQTPRFLPRLWKK
jgi:protein-S-isoprenylcysteine O-methyltransferase Ste14